MIRTKLRTGTAVINQTSRCFVLFRFLTGGGRGAQTCMSNNFTDTDRKHTGYGSSVPFILAAL